MLGGLPRGLGSSLTSNLLNLLDMGVGLVSEGNKGIAVGQTLGNELIRQPVSDSADELLSLYSSLRIG